MSNNQYLLNIYYVQGAMPVPWERRESIPLVKAFPVYLKKLDLNCERITSSAVPSIALK